jgi:hypothetical protein
VTIDYERLMALRIADTEQTYTARDTILYALAVGVAADPLDRADLPISPSRTSGCSARRRCPRSGAGEARR